MTLPHDPRRELLGLYAIGALEGAERAAVETHLAECAECRTELLSFRQVAGGLASAVPLREPSLDLRRRVLAVAADDRPDAPAAPVREMRAPAPAWLALAAAVVLAAGPGWYNQELRGRVRSLQAALRSAQMRADTAERRVLEIQRRTDDAQFSVAVLSAADLARVDLAGQPPAPKASGRAFWSRSKGLVFTAANLPPLPAGKVYQLWVVTAQKPISAGLLRPDASGSIEAIVQTPTDIGTPVAMAVTIEPEGGVPAPTGEKYLVGVPAAS